jgi:DNA-binding response OmpR family regulator
MRSTPPSALLISPLDEDEDALRGLFAEQGWTLRCANSITRASTILHDAAPTVVITEADLPVGTWRDVLEIMCFLPKPPLVIVTSIQADDHLWVEALNLGAHDVLAKPFDTAEVIRVMTAAWMRNERTRPKRKALSA